MSNHASHWPHRRRRRSGIRFVDIFCGAGGEAIGLEDAGMELVLGANHWNRAIETHSWNFPHADHLCADVSNYDMRKLPPAEVGWFSPECTWHSPAGGRKRMRKQLDMFDDYVPDAAGVKSRATALDVINAVQAQRYLAFVVENVVEFAGWELFDWWLAGLEKLGYDYQFVSVSAAHIGGEGNEPAPQWRDRLFIVFMRKDVGRKPNLDPRPPAWCFDCEKSVCARQSWKKPGRTIGKYGQQYVYRCPNQECRHSIVEPFVMPAAAAIDWSDLGTRIGDRKKPLAPATMRRIEAGLEQFAGPLAVAVAGGTYEREGSGYYRVTPTDDAPLRTRTATSGDALVSPPFLVKNYGDESEAKYRCHPIADPLGAITATLSTGLTAPEPFVTMLRANNRATGANGEPMATLATGRHHYLTVPPGSFVMKNHGGLDYKNIGHMTKDVAEPLGTIVAKPNLSLVIPYRRGKAKTSAEPLHTLATRESAALCSIEVDPMDCFYRMLRGREHLRGQRFHDTYEVKGNAGEVTMQAGNAVPCNVAQWIGEALIEVLA